MPETTPAGATPAAGGATPPQSAPSLTPPPTTPLPSTPEPPASSATDYPEGLGDAGKQAIDRMKADREAERERAKAEKARADAAETELEKLRRQTLSDGEKAVADAKEAGASEATAKADARVRRAEIRTALTAAGVNPKLLDIVAKADEFAALTVTEDGDVEGLREAVTAFKRSNPDLFGGAPGVDLGAGGSAGRGLTREQIRAMSPGEYAARRDEVMAFLTKTQ